jgi:hypothetical protein
MATGDVVKVYHDGTTIFIVVRVDEGGVLGVTDYTASVPKAVIEAISTAADKKAALIAAVKAVRDERIKTVLTDVPVPPGQVTL